MNLRRIARYTSGMVSIRLWQCCLAVIALPLLGAPATASDDGRRARILAPTTDFSSPERWEVRQGGTATNMRRLGREAYSQPSQNLSFEQRAQFFVGNGLFKRLWVSAPASTRSADGLGPLYNARACQRCHLKDGRGHPPEHDGDSAVSMLLKLGIPLEGESLAAGLADGRATRGDPVYGHQLQDLAVPGVPPEGQLRVRYTPQLFTFPDGERIELRRPTYSVDAPGYGALDPATVLGPRVAQPMIGLGLLEAVDAADIEAMADPDDADGDGISGRVNRVRHPVSGALALGRFGWKAGQPDLEAQMMVASANDMGISNTQHPDGWGDCTTAQVACREAPHGDVPVAGSAAEATGARELEAGEAVMAAQLFYSRHLAVPARRDVRRASGARRQAGVLLLRLYRLPRAEARDPARRCRSRARRPADLAVHRPAAARHGRGAGGRPAGVGWPVARNGARHRCGGSV